MNQVKIIVEKHNDGYVAYPVGLKGVVVGEGETYGEALADVKSAIRFHITRSAMTSWKPIRRFSRRSSTMCERKSGVENGLAQTAAGVTRSIVSTYSTNVRSVFEVGNCAVDIVSCIPISIPRITAD